MKNRLIISSIFTMSLLSGCWLTDGKIIEKQAIFGNYCMLEEQNNLGEGLALAKKRTKGDYVIIQDECIEIYSDSTDFYMKFNVNGSKYYARTKVIHDTIGFSHDAQVIPMDLFNKYLKSCKECKLIYDSRK